MKCPKFPCTASNIKVAVNKCNSRCKPSNTYETIRLKPNFCCKINSLTQDMLCKENAKYVIEYDFSLLGQTITVPKNSILEFDGGTLSNGTIIGQDTYINDVGGLGVDTLFGESITRNGTWRINESGGSSGGGIPDKEYDPDAHSGLGRKTLQLKDGSNVLTQEDFDAENTIYVIGYDFDLNGGRIEIPENCVLEFDGGSLSNGTLVLKNTFLDGVVTISNIVVSGTCTNSILTPKLFGAKGDGVTDDTQSFRSLETIINNQNTKSKTIYIPEGEYILNERINILTSCKIYGEGVKSVIKLPGGNGGIYLNWSDTKDYFRSCELIQGCTITADVTKGSNQIVVNDASGISVGDYLIITDTVDYSFNTDRASYRQSEIVRVSAINGNTINLYNSLYGDYYVDFEEGDEHTAKDSPNYRTAISKFTPNQYLVSNIKIVSTYGTDSPQTYFSFGAWGIINSTFKNIVIENYGNAVAASIGVGLQWEVENCSIKSYFESGSDRYGLSCIHSQDFRVSNSVFKAKNHALSTGGKSSIYSIVNRNFIYEKVSFDSPTLGKIDLDVHANAEYYKYKDIDAPSSVCDTGGRNVIVENCRFYKISTNFHDCGLTIRNCEIVNSASEYLLDFNNNGDYENSSLTIENCKINCSFIFRFDLQDVAYTKKQLGSFIFRNNTIKGGKLRLFRGQTAKLVINDNIFIDSGIENQVKCDSIEICNNIIYNGKLDIISSVNIAKFICTGNQIFNLSEVCYINRVKGLFANNKIYGNIASEMMLIYGGSEVELINNSFLNEHSTTRPIQTTSPKCKILAINNRSNYKGDNIIRSYNAAHDITESSVLSITDAYAKRVNNNIKGISVFDETRRIAAFVSDGPTGASIGTLSSSKSVAVVAENNFLTEGDKYYVSFSVDKTHTIGFSDKQDIADPTAKLLVVVNSTTYNDNFEAPSPTEYPYIYYISNRTIEDIATFYNNRNLSESDGATINVKRSGNTDSRPSAIDIYQGFEYLDTDIEQKIMASSLSGGVVTWKAVDGGQPIRRFGTTAQRPAYIHLDLLNSTSVNIGLDANKTDDTTLYFDTTINKLLRPFYNSYAYYVNWSVNGTRSGSNNIPSGATCFIYKKNNASSSTKVYFARTLEDSVDDMLEITLDDRNSFVFIAPDPSVYPYVYAEGVSGEVCISKIIVWCEYDNNAAGVKRSNSTENRPIGTQINVGFMYFDTTLGKLVYAKAISGDTVTWVDATGATV